MKDEERRKRRNALERARYHGFSSGLRRKAAGTARDSRLRYERSEKGKNTRWVKKGRPIPTRPMPGRCECCNRLPTGRGRDRLHNDHDHSTGKFRGWLCHHCNTGIGLLGDTRLGVSFAMAYLSLQE